jgi:hypothetical protein
MVSQALKQWTNISFQIGFENFYTNFIYIFVCEKYVFLISMIKLEE